MFAVVILGIGFIMIASIFPVAVEQTRSNADDNRGNQLAVNCIHAISTTFSADDFPDNGGTLQAFSSQPTLWQKIDDSLIDPADSRYACVPFFWKSPVDGSVRITVLAVHRSSHAGYSTNDLSQGELAPRGVGSVSVIIQGDGTQAVQIGKTSGDYLSVGDNCFLILASGDGDVNGRTLRVGHKISEDPDYITWSLRSDGGLAPGETCTNASAQLIGLDWVDPASARSGYVGPSQDLAVYTTFLGHPLSH
jgi:type II secretory pathway pseudopilin PulG